MTKQTTSGLGLITRRGALSGCLAGAAALALPLEGVTATGGPMSAAAPPARRPDMRRQTDLYAFRAQAVDKMVVAVTWPRESRGRFRLPPQIPETRLYIGDRMWSSLNVSPGESHVGQAHDSIRIFSGHVAESVNANTVGLEVLLAEGSSTRWAGQGIWAEQLWEDGSRQRMGSPFLAALVSQDESLAALYDASSPATDARMLFDPIACAIGKRARKAGYSGDADLHGRRLAAALLPDMLKYDPVLPSGFTFAARNGRHPRDSDPTVVNSILNGFPGAERPTRGTMLLPTFPYFQSLSAPV